MQQSFKEVEQESNIPGIINWNAKRLETTLVHYPLCIEINSIRWYMGDITGK